MATPGYVSPQKYTAELQRLCLSETLYRKALAVRTPRLRPVVLEMLRRAREMGMIQHRYGWFGSVSRPEQRQAARRAAWVQREGEFLAKMAGYEADEHGFTSRGDHWKITTLDYVPPRDSAAAPYFDAGGAGMALIRIDRTRVYAKSCKWSPSRTSTYYVVGRNEAGTYYGHAVTPAPTLVEALAWVWSGYQVIARQGDIALVRGGKSGYIPTLPGGHVVTSDGVTHPTHPTLRLPQAGERIIVARRAGTRVSSETRD